MQSLVAHDISVSRATDNRFECGGVITMLLDETRMLPIETRPDGAIELQSLVDSHQQPFVIIDKNYRIMAVNKAYERTYGVSQSGAVGHYCYKVSHNNDAPCCESGEDCPHQHLFERGEQHSTACTCTTTRTTACTRCGSRPTR